jgi:hypothetical protein
VERDGKKMNVVAIRPVAALDVDLCDVTSNEMLPIRVSSTDMVDCVEAEAPGTEPVDVKEKIQEQSSHPYVHFLVHDSIYCLKH